MVTKDIFECDLCRQLTSSMLVHYPDAFTYDNVQRFRIEMCWPSKKTIDKGKIYFAMVKSGTKKSTYNFNHIYILDVWLAGNHTMSFDLPFVVEDAIPHAMDSSTALGLAKHWLKGCLTDGSGHHKWCNDKVETCRPTGLLDIVGSKSTGMLRLVHTGTSEAKTFVTLSHCWGHNVQPILTTQNVEERCKSGISIDTLPKTFQDAVTVATWFNGA
ncbi:hypothetical protein LTR86_006617 [Recurvomyces mirabilis]|nr:hypothetical protein LTR86_006617 [Recurvomyces mirabilis]